jgi:hypothetical protein
MNDPYRGTSIASRLGSSEFDMGSGRVELALVKHTPLGTGRTSGVYKDDRPVSFIFVPSTGFRWQVMQKVSTVWCARFDGSTIDHFLEEIFRDTTKRSCVISDFFSGKGRAVQMWNSLRYLEASCKLCRAMDQGHIGMDEGHSPFRLLFAQTGWILLEQGMERATEGNPQFVQRSANGTTTSHQWVQGIARILACHRRAMRELLRKSSREEW